MGETRAFVCFLSVSLLLCCFVFFFVVVFARTRIHDTCASMHARPHSRVVSVASLLFIVLFFLLSSRGRASIILAHQCMLARTHAFLSVCFLSAFFCFVLFLLSSRWRASIILAHQCMLARTYAYLLSIRACRALRCVGQINASYMYIFDTVMVFGHDQIH